MRIAVTIGRPVALSGEGSGRRRSAGELVGEDRCCRSPPVNSTTVQCPQSLLNAQTHVTRQFRQPPRNRALDSAGTPDPGRPADAPGHVLPPGAAATRPRAAATLRDHVPPQDPGDLTANIPFFFHEHAARHDHGDFPRTPAPPPAEGPPPASTRTVYTGLIRHAGCL